MFVHFCKLHNILEVGIGIHFLHKTSQHFITEDIVSLQRRQDYHEDEIWIVKNGHNYYCQFLTHHVGNESRSLSTSRLNGLEDIYHTFCLQTLQLRVDADERPSASNSITIENIILWIVM